MGRKRKPYRLKKRGKIYYYKLINSERFLTTGCTSKTDADLFVSNKLVRYGYKNVESMLFSKYAEPFFDWERCPHVSRKREEGSTINKNYASIQRSNLQRYILTSKLSSLVLSEIKRSDILDFRTSLTKKNLANSTINKILSALKVIFNEAFFREDILNNPATSVGLLKEEREQRDALTVDELKQLFPDDYKKVWRDEIDYTCFLIAAKTGMRRGEVLALRWKNVDFEKNTIVICEARKGTYEVGLPKWDKTRSIYMSESLKERLIQYKENKIGCKPDDYVITDLDGKELKNTWWKKRFDRAIKIAGIDCTNRNITPHSLRHTLNTMLLSAGESPDKIQATFGWSSKETQENYTHWRPEHFKSQGEVIDKLF